MTLMSVVVIGGPDSRVRTVGGHRRARIKRNEFPPRQPLPSESQLMGEYGVSRGSVRHALQVLAEEGLTVTIQGRGTYVLPLEDN